MADIELLVFVHNLMVSSFTIKHFVGCLMANPVKTHVYGKRNKQISVTVGKHLKSFAEKVPKSKYLGEKKPKKYIFSNWF